MSVQGNEQIQTRWEACIADLQNNPDLTRRVKGSLDKAQPQGLFGTTLIIAVPNEYTRDVFQRELNVAFKEALNRAFPEDMGITEAFVIDPELETPVPGRAQATASPQQLRSPRPDAAPLTWARMGGMESRSPSSRFTRWVLDDATALAAILEPDRPRMGIYILEFSDGERYVGQTVDLLSRFASHRRRWPGEIVAVSFLPAERERLNQIERDVISRATSIWSASLCARMPSTCWWIGRSRPSGWMDGRSHA